ncbi:hypothetical protein ACVRZR_10305 [Streptococcus entericus]|uniref:hypothetical protein n=1 Tax=Streptococcus entericus TaxID=155680 RepID=UPI00037BA300|nr:hypothetical protein [Streptococcus entericus]
MFKNIMLFVTFFISAVIMLTTAFILFHLGVPPLPVGDDTTGMVLVWLFLLPHYFLPLTSFILSLVFFTKARKVYKTLGGVA